MNHKDKYCPDCEAKLVGTKYIGNRIVEVQTNQENNSRHARTYKKAVAGARRMHQIINNGRFPCGLCLLAYIETVNALL